MKIIIAGSRDYGITFKEKQKVFLLLDVIFSKLELKSPPVVLCGKADGIDSCGEDYAKQKGWQVDPYPADWTSLGNAAGPIRNQQMVTEADMLVVIRFKDSKGSKDVLARAKTKGIKIIDLVI
jgi:hypothetical protein